MPRNESEYKPGQNPESQRNLQPRKPMYGEAKRRRQLLATDAGWAGFKAIAARLGLSASELVEQIGRGAIKLKE